MNLTRYQHYSEGVCHAVVSMAGWFVTSHRHKDEGFWTACGVRLPERSRVHTGRKVRCKHCLDAIDELRP